MKSLLTLIIICGALAATAATDDGSSLEVVYEDFALGGCSTPTCPTPRPTNSSPGDRARIRGHTRFPSYKAPTRERFEVTEENHQRHIVPRAGDDTVAESISAQRAATQDPCLTGGEDGICAIGFSNYEAGVKAADWLDRSLLRPNGEVAALRRLPGDPAAALADPAPEGDTEEEEATVEPVAGYELSKDAGDGEDGEEPNAWVSADGSVLDLRNAPAPSPATSRTRVALALAANLGWQLRRLPYGIESAILAQTVVGHACASTSRYIAAEAGRSASDGSAGCRDV